MCLATNTQPQSGRGSRRCWSGLRRHFRRLVRSDFGFGAGPGAHDRAHTRGRASAHQHKSHRRANRGAGDYLVRPAAQPAPAAFGAEEGARLYRVFSDVFPAGYQEDTKPRDACSDVQQLDTMLRDESRRTVSLYVPEDSLPGHMHFMVYSRNEPIALSEALPVLERMGVDVYTERPYEVNLKSGECFWIQDFHLRHESGAAVDIEAVSKRFESCFLAVLGGAGGKRRPESPCRQRRPRLAADGTAALLCETHPATETSVQPGVHGRCAGRACRSSRALLVKKFEFSLTPIFRTQNAYRELKEINDAGPARCRQGAQRRRRPHSHGFRRRHRCHIAQQLFSDYRWHECAQAVYLDKARSCASSRNSIAATAFRSVCLFARSRGRAFEGW